MTKIKSYCKNNLIYILFSYVLTFFLICSYIFRDSTGFETFPVLFGCLITALLLTPIVSFIITKLANFTISVNPTNNHIIDYLYQHTLFYSIIILVLQLPVFLAFYPGMIYYDIGVQVDQYDRLDFITNHPLLHTLFTGYFKNLFAEPNTGYAIATLVQMGIVCLAMGYSLQYLYKKTKSIVLCTISILFYGLFPVNSLLTISSTKDILFAAFVLVFFIDTLRYLQSDIQSRFSYARMPVNIALLLLFRNNALFAFLPASFLFVIIQMKTKKNWKIPVLFILVTLLLFKGTDRFLITITQANKGSIKEMMSIPAQGMSRIYLNTDNENDKELIRFYISEPEEYRDYISDPVKQQLPFEVLDSKCKHFLLHSAILFCKNPIIAIDSVFYNTQGYWDPFHCPYQSDHFFLAAGEYRGEATLDTKITPIKELYTKYFYITENYQHNPFADLIFNIGSYVWLFLFSAVIAIKRKNRPLVLCSLFPFFYLLTLLLGPSAIIRYAFPYILLAPVFIGFIFLKPACTKP